MLFRLKFKIDALVTEILDQLPKEVFESRTTTFFDPAMAGGQFVVQIEKRLRACGHSDENIASRVYGLAEDIIDLNYAINTKKLIGRYAVGGLEEMEQCNMKFDVIVGNPPYQGTTNSKSGKNLQPIWPKFLCKAFNLVHINGYVAFVTPRTWASGSRNITKTFFKDYRIVFLNMNVTKYFNIIGDVSAYVLQNCEPGKSLTTIIDVAGDPMNIDMTKFDYIPFNASRLGLAIFEKTVLTTEHFSFVESKQQISSSTGPRILFLAGRNGAYSGRVFVESIIKTKKGIGQIAKLTKPFTSSDAVVLEKNLKLKLYPFLFNLLGGNRGLNRTWILNSLPRIDHKKLWTDVELYKYFGLTQEEINYIEEENNVK